MKRLRLLLLILVCAVAIGPHALLAEEPTVVSVAIDIKPGSDPNCFNNDGHGVIPVAILGASDFDAHAVDAGTVQLEGLEVAARGKSNKLLAAFEDVNADGYMDLVIKIEDSDGAFAEGSTTATLTGELTDGTLFEGTDSICIVPPHPQPEETMTVFVTSGQYTGDLGGLEGADVICQGLADASDQVPDGTYIAWLSIGDGDYASPATGRFEQSSVPYVLVDGTVIANDWSDLTTLNEGSEAEYLQALINMDENGNTVGAATTWTATEADGTCSGEGSCLGWTTADAEWFEQNAGYYDFVNAGDTGATNETDHRWSHVGYQPCGPNPYVSGPSYENHLYCFQQTAPPPYPEPPDTEKIVFVTSAWYYGTLDGLDGADAKCQAHADGAGLEGTYKAWLSTEAESPASGRFTHATVPYVLVDGTVIADDWTDLTTLNEGSTTDYLQAPINVQEDGEEQPSGLYVWTATSADGTHYGGWGDCGNWTDESVAATVGTYARVDHAWTFEISNNCYNAALLYCFEQ